MNFYERYILPRAIHLVCGVGPIRRQRKKVVPEARGRVLEVGIGSGHNLPFYDTSKVSKVFGLDPSKEMRRMAARAAAKLGLDVEFIGLPGEEIPLEDRSVDTVVMTFTLCSIPDPIKALLQMKRVLKPGGRLLFSEHGAAPEASVRKWQDRLTPVWKRLAGGCRLNLEVPALLEEAGFRVDSLESLYLPGFRPVSFNYFGEAKPGEVPAEGAL